MTEIKKFIGRAASFGLAASMILSTGITAYAEAGAPVHDESLYVTLDAYGEIQESSVVKSYNLNGAKQVVDYGSYKEIHNMTDEVPPLIEDGKVTFNLPEGTGHDRFYFEGMRDNAETAAVLPWNLTVRYKLNGVEKKIEDLAHEKGMVEIFIDAVPNGSASEYYRNNMTLAAVAIVDMDKNLSVEAPGAQVQSVGSMKAVVFMALPGEEQNFELRIGSNDFEFSGLSFMMLPVTLGQLDRLDDLRDARDTVKDSADAIDDSLDVVLDSLDGVQSGLSDTVEGLKKLDQSRQTIADAKDGIYVDADNALEILKELSDRGVPFTSYVADAQDALEDANHDLNQITDTVNDLDSQLDNLHWGLRDVSRDLNDVTDLLNDGRHDIRQWENKLAQLRRDLETLKGYKKLVNQKLEELKQLLQALKKVQKTLEEHGDVMGIPDEKLQELLAIIEELTGGEIPPELVEIIASSSDAIKQKVDEIIKSGVIQNDPNLQQLIAILEKLIGAAQQSSKLEDMISDVQITVGSMENVISRVSGDGESLENVLGSTGDMADTLRRSTTTGSELITDLNQITETLNKYHGTAKSAVNDAGKLIDSAVRGTDAMYLLMKNVEGKLKEAGTPLNEGAAVTIDGLSSALSEAVVGLEKTGVVKDAKTTVKDLIDDKWDEYTGEDMTLLNVDSEAKKLSFTSGENPEPESLQIILRTEGTVETEDEAEEAVDETFHAKGNFLQRIWSIFMKIVDAVKSIFK